MMQKTESEELMSQTLFVPFITEGHIPSQAQANLSSHSLSLFSKSYPSDLNRTHQQNGNKISHIQPNKLQHHPFSHHSLLPFQHNNNNTNPYTSSLHTNLIQNTSKNTLYNAAKLDSTNFLHFMKCNTSLLSPNNPFIHHISRHHPQNESNRRWYPCPCCVYVTNRKNNLKRHISTMHQQCSSQLECCGEFFSNKASMKDHVIKAHDSGYACPFCGRNFCRKALLKRHLEVHNSNKQFKCTVCPYATSHKSNLQRHKRVHSKDYTPQEPMQVAERVDYGKATNGQDGASQSFKSGGDSMSIHKGEAAFEQFQKNSYMQKTQNKICEDEIRSHKKVGVPPSITSPFLYALCWRQPELYLRHNNNKNNNKDSIKKNNNNNNIDNMYIAGGYDFREKEEKEEKEEEEKREDDDGEVDANTDDNFNDDVKTGSQYGEDMNANTSPSAACTNKMKNITNEVHNNEKTEESNNEKKKNENNKNNNNTKNKKGIFRLVDVISPDWKAP